MTSHAAAPSQGPAQARFRDYLWTAARPIYRAILEHPFIAGLGDGSLPPDRFLYYVVQDHHYLQGFSRALGLIAGRAPSNAELEFFATSAVQVVAVEHLLHEGFLADFGLDAAAVAAIPVTPTTAGYVDFMLARAGTNGYLDAVAAVLPCYWIYREVGAELIRGGSPEPRYQRWIDTYGDEAFAATVDRLLEIVDAAGADLDEAEQQRFTALWLRGCRYEWMFWDAAWRNEHWPV